MIGHVDNSGRAIMSVPVRATHVAPISAIQAWIDTGFTGDLVLPQRTIEELALQHSVTVRAILADGSEVVLKTYSCTIDWFGEERHLEVIANDGDYPLLGIGLLRDRDLHISYRTGGITVE
jgi:clan AA aspartic protease